MIEGINKGISEADYHAFPAVSKSKLWAFSKNPHKWSLTKDIPMAPTAAMNWGSLVDCLILQPHELSQCFAVSSFPDFRSKEAQSWKAAQTVPVVSLADVAEAKEAADVVRQHHFARIMLDGAETQVSAVFGGIEQGTGEKFLGKCRLDIVPAASGAFSDWLVDLKTTQSLAKIEKTIAEFAYHAQAAWYLDMFNAASGENRTRWGFIFQESEAPYEVAVVELDQESIAAGRQWYLHALEQWCHSHKYNSFPNPFDDEIRVVGIPNWAK